MNKRGEEEELLPKETINLIIAVICIGALAILATAIYFAVTGNQNLKDAQAVVNGDNGIANEIRRINAGGIPNSEGKIVPNPSGWNIFSFVEQGVKPNSCAGENCLCICEKLAVGIVNVDTRQAKRCDDKGVCVVVANLKKFDAIEIKKGGIFISIKKINDLIEITKND